MKLSFNYSEPEFVEYQLYVAAKSPVMQKKRKRNRILVSLIYVGIGLTGLITKNYTFLAMFVGVGVLWYFTFPLWSSKFYAKQYKRFVQAQYKDRFGKEVTVDFLDATNEVELTESGQSVLIYYNEFAEIAETPLDFLIKLKTEMVIVIQKTCTLPTEEVRAILRAIAAREQIDYVDDRNWSWK